MLDFPLLYKIKSALKKPPRILFNRLVIEIHGYLEIFIIPIRLLKFTNGAFLKQVGETDINALWEKIEGNEFFINFNRKFLKNYHVDFSEDFTRISIASDKAMSNKISLLGSGEFFLGEKINWYKDYKTNIQWYPKYFKKIRYCNPHDLSDVKIPWEISRLQWLMPVCQMYLITGDEKYAKKVRLVLISWITDNPYGKSVNWACTMEAALRIFTWSYFFHVFKNSESWKNSDFRELFLKNLWLHIDFTDRYIEISDINGNHFTADAAGLVVGGLFFGTDGQAKKWVDKGWKYLLIEIKKQVFSDGVDYEASIPYHRLVLELFFIPAYFRLKKKLPVPSYYRDLVVKMALFTSAYSRPDGSAPVWGDADDARVLPFQTNAINDHRYLIGLVGIGFDSKKLLQLFSGDKTELLWFYSEYPELLDNYYLKNKKSEAFTESGFYILKDCKNHIFIDCGPIGLAGRGGHGHNDILSFEAFLNNELIIVDSGSYVYTANFRERNKFRSTSYHNTPQIDHQEVNNFIRWDYLWNLKNEAIPKVLFWKPDENYSVFQGTHFGYHKLKPKLSPIRLISLIHNTSELCIEDSFVGEGKYNITIPFHFNTTFKLIPQSENTWICKSSKQSFIITNYSANWAVSIQKCRISFRYGVLADSSKLIFSTMGDNKSKLSLKIKPVDESI